MNNDLETAETEDIVHWPLLISTGRALLSTMSHFCIFNEGASALLLSTTPRARLYALGLNHHGCLGVGHTDPVGQPTEIVELRGKTVHQIELGWRHVLLRTAQGELFAWGGNECGQVGRGVLGVHQTRPLRLDPLCTPSIKMVKCADTYSLVLDETGSLWAFGQLVPTEECMLARPAMLSLEGLEHGECVVQITCGRYNCLALTTAHKLYIWGKFTWVQFMQPTQISLPSGFIPSSTMASGFENFVLISTSGSIWFRSTVEYVYRESEPIRTVASSNGSYCFQLQRSKRIMVWYSPTQRVTISLTSVPDAVAFYISPDTPTLTRLPPEVIEKRKWAAATRRRFQEMNGSDLKLVLRDTGLKMVYLRRKEAKAVSSYLSQKITGPWRNKPEVVLTQYPSMVYFAFLRYLLTNTLTFDTSWACELLDLANQTQSSTLQEAILIHLTSEPNYFDNLTQNQQQTLAQGLGSTLSRDNCWVYYELAAKCKNEALQRRMVKMVAQQAFKDVRYSEGFKKAKPMYRKELMRRAFPGRKLNSKL